ncbi:transposase [Aneurinibacillus thermoaerophilus]|uniref:transposase n=1 Tax=Aneurinibacillus thermoaerophilus TaxID=143495 RepID=UPI002E235590|nr:transposase [Aneurinibacillus thermoaerophilus]
MNNTLMEVGHLVQLHWSRKKENSICTFLYLHISVKKEIPDIDETSVKNVVGVDMGMNFLVTAIDSKDRMLFVGSRHIKNKKAQYKRIRKQLQQRQTPSARRRLKKIGNRENRFQTDLNHKVSKALIRFAGKNSLIALEDLTGIRSATTRVKRKNRYYSVSWAFHQLRFFIEYKAKRAGIKVIAFDPKYTSQKCPKCGHTEKVNRNKKTHTFSCKTCQYTSNDDRIGAMNLRTKGIEYLHNVSVQA